MRSTRSGERGCPPEDLSERGSAVVDFVLVTVLLLPLVSGVLQLALALYARNTAMTAASEGARFGATVGHDPADGAQRARSLLNGVSGSSFVTNVRGTATSLHGAAAVAIAVEVRVPALGLAGPAVNLTVTGHAIREEQ